MNQSLSNALILTTSSNRHGGVARTIHCRISTGSGE